MSPVTAVISLTCKEPPPKEKETKEKKSPSRMIKDKHKRKRKESDTEREEEKEFESLEEEAKAVCLLRHPSQDESDAAPSGSETPQRTDGEDNDKWSVSDNQSVSGRMMSPGRGRGMKRKRIVHNRHSQMVVDRKYVRGKQKDRDDKKDEDSDGEEEEEEVARDTFISMKNKVHRMMEQEQSLENFSPLGFPPLEDIMVMPEAEIVEILERRLNELREIYQHSKADLLIMDKKRRRQIEKRILMSNGKVHVDGRNLLRRYSRRAYKAVLSIQDSLFPFHLHEFGYATAIWVAMDILGISIFAEEVATLENIVQLVFEWVNLIKSFTFPIINNRNFVIGAAILTKCVFTCYFNYILIRPSLLLHCFCVAFVATVSLLFVLLGIRLAITLMLYYHGWLFEIVGKPPSLVTKIFMYLETVRPLLDDDKFAEIEQQAAEFRNTIADQLQRKLWMKWIISRNYLSDWWKEVVYMRYRNSLINTNVGCADVIYQTTTSNQAARAAFVTLCRQQFCKDIFVKNTMKPISMGGIPLCATQYIDYHRTLRVPNEISDITIRLRDARHIAVYSKGCWYKVNIFHGKRILRAAELEHYLVVAGTNKDSLTLIENALEIVFLDDEERCYDETDSTKYDREYARTLTGDGYKLWCDKPSVYIISKNGRVINALNIFQCYDNSKTQFQFTSNAEHSGVDAMIYVHVREYLKYHEAFGKPYSPDGHCLGEVEFIPKPERLTWELDQETLSAINDAYKVSKGVADNLENSHVVFTDYGKNFIKKANVSPDAYIQMALQMAYYKDQGKFELTYEPAVMRLFKDGRTETVRSCSSHSCEFVRAMLDKTRDDNIRFALLKTACEHHQNYYRNAMAGKGVDRHLFGMYIVAKYYQIASPFLDNVFSMNYALSTSQTPQHQMMEYSRALNKEKDLFWPAGAFSCPEGSNYG
uniref:Carnitine O-palmitoyltransferase n=1 Tax=Heterorhabditis bacteriophora TaxID=37862 RepID=A0A1I7XKU5_HETBA